MLYSEKMQQKKSLKRKIRKDFYKVKQELGLTNYIFEMPESDVEVIATFKALPPTPDTYDGILLYVVIGSISLLGLILGLVSLKKRMN